MPPDNLPGGSRSTYTADRRGRRRPGSVGAARRGAAASLPVAIPEERLAFEYAKDYLRTPVCPECHRRVFFVRHADGVAWVNDLEWPWKRHACLLEGEANGAAVGDTLDASRVLQTPRVGLVVHVSFVPGASKCIATVAIPPHAPEDWRVFDVPNPRDLVGALVALSAEEVKMVFRGVGYPIAVAQQACVRCGALVRATEMDEHLQAKHGVRICPDCQRLVRVAAFEPHRQRCQQVTRRRP